jgi:hypothetical protein
MKRRRRICWASKESAGCAEMEDLGKRREGERIGGRGMCVWFGLVWVIDVISLVRYLIVSRLWNGDISHLKVLQNLFVG